MRHIFCTLIIARFLYCLCFSRRKSYGDVKRDKFTHSLRHRHFSIHLASMAQMFFHRNSFCVKNYYWDNDSINFHFMRTGKTFICLQSRNEYDWNLFTFPKDEACHIVAIIRRMILISHITQHLLIVGGYWYFINLRVVNLRFSFSYRPLTVLFWSSQYHHLIFIFARTRTFIVESGRWRHYFTCALSIYIWKKRTIFLRRFVCFL